MIGGGEGTSATLSAAQRLGIRKTMIELYGIPNCDTVRKARKWLDAQDVTFTFHDFKKEGVEPERLAAWADAAGWEAILNKRGTTFRKLSEDDKAEIDRPKAMNLMAAQPSLIKRPVVEHADGILVGFDEDRWRTALI